jgi:hypothetical protein
MNRRDAHVEQPDSRLTDAEEHGFVIIARSTALMAVATGLIAATGDISAHHSFTAAFEAKAPVILTGVVLRVEWKNPHVMFSIDETASSGAVTTWRFELGAPSVLLQRGWMRASLKPGDTVTVDGIRARDGTHYARVVSVTLGNGRTVFANDATNRGSTQ